jgi:N-acylneuraminate cytidylyltransferase/CMP-N,N'-diacetyllegionaminic acid synthase
MIDKKKVLAIIPARGGSKGLPGKNIKILGGKPLIAWSIEAALNSAEIDRTIVTTDAEDIAQVAIEFGADVPFLRPEELAADDTSSADVVLHVLNTLEEEYDIIVLLQPTSPFRTSQHIQQAFAQCKEHNNYTLISACESDKSPDWLFWNEGNKLEPILGENSKATRRQDVRKAYVLNGAIYVVEVNRFKQHLKFLHDNSLPFVMDKQSSVDIDDVMDFKFAELVLNEKPLAKL